VAFGIFHELEYIVTSMYNLRKLSIDCKQTSDALPSFFLVFIYACLTAEQPTSSIKVTSTSTLLLLELLSTGLRLCCSRLSSPTSSSSNALVWMTAQLHFSHTHTRSVFTGPSHFFCSFCVCVAGFWLVVLGQSFRSLAMFHAKSNFSHIISTRKESTHQLVTTGVYRYFHARSSDMTLLLSSLTSSIRLFPNMIVSLVTPRTLGFSGSQWACSCSSATLFPLCSTSTPAGSSSLIESHMKKSS